MAQTIAKPALQETLLQQAPDIEALLSHYQLDTTAFVEKTKEAEHFTVRVPLVGAFSSGKTSLINALLGNKYFAVEVNAETSLPVELSFGDEVSFTGHGKQGVSLPYSQEQVLQQSYDAILPDGWLKARLPAEQLAHFPFLTLVDMPGWDSGIAQHSKAIDEYITRSLAYAIVVSAEEGTLRDSIRSFLGELAQRNMPALLIVTKTDKKPAEDIEAVVTKLKAEVTDLLGQPPLAVAVVSARKKQITSFTNALTSLYGKMDERFAQAILVPVTEQLRQLAVRLEQLGNADNLDAEQIRARNEELYQEAEQFRQRLALQEQQLDQDLQQGVERVLGHVRARLQSNTQNLANDLIYGSGLEGNIMTIVRLALAESVEKEFSAHIGRYLNNVASDVPQGITVSSQFNANTDGFKISDETSNTFTTTLVSMLPLMIPAVGLPLKVLGVVGAVLVDVARNFFSKTNKELEAARQQEAAESQIRSQCIPAVMNQVEAHLRQQIQQQGQSIKDKVAEETNNYLQQNQQTLQELEQQLRQGEAAFAEKRQQYLKDLTTVKQWIQLFNTKETGQ
ncbi:dynamin family protein [Oceanimonas baumannii]|uniref:dynamin family protein n=1 Tax=Oceanimonas baumannii TaxID=129578 RepID=UPI001D18B159|nr:dynamin family protein [Oceanimonas baumannii]MCC4263333.1 dynamin family protein [Oceanimonas baumannii]